MFISGGQEISSMEGTTQGQALAMPWYSMNTVTIIQRFNNLDANIKQIWLADDAAGGGKIQSLRNWYDHLVTEGRKYGYGSKSWLIVKSETIAKEAESIFENSVNITIEGKWHLGSVIGSQNYKDEF